MKARKGQRRTERTNKMRFAMTVLMLLASLAVADPATQSTGTAAIQCAIKPDTPKHLVPAIEKLIESRARRLENLRADLATEKANFGKLQQSTSYRTYKERVETIKKAKESIASIQRELELQGRAVSFFAEPLNFNAAIGTIGLLPDFKFERLDEAGRPRVRFQQVVRRKVHIDRLSNPAQEVGVIGGRPAITGAQMAHREKMLASDKTPPKTEDTKGTYVLIGLKNDEMVSERLSKGGGRFAYVESVVTDAFGETAPVILVFSPSDYIEQK